jgi:kynurenine formamidase
VVVRAVKHARHGVMAHRVITIMHIGTHMNAVEDRPQDPSRRRLPTIEQVGGDGDVLLGVRAPWR